MTVDLHGYRETEAMGIILSSMMSLESSVDEIEFIVGKGIVLGDLVFELAEQEGYYASYNGGNTGSIIIKK